MAVHTVHNLQNTMKYSLSGFHALLGGNCKFAITKMFFSMKVVKAGIYSHKISCCMGSSILSLCAQGLFISVWFLRVGLVELYFTVKQVLQCVTTKVKS